MYYIEYMQAMVGEKDSKKALRVIGLRDTHIQGNRLRPHVHVLDIGPLAGKSDEVILIHVLCTSIDRPLIWLKGDAR